MAFHTGNRVSFEWPVIRRRRVRVEEFLLRGVTARQIARRLGVSLRTAASDIAAVYALWVDDSTSGLVNTPPPSYTQLHAVREQDPAAGTTGEGAKKIDGRGLTNPL